jgi:hypothetical protein
LTSQQSAIDDNPRIRKPGKYRTSSSLSTRSNALTRPSLHGLDEVSGLTSHFTSQHSQLQVAVTESAPSKHPPSGASTPICDAEIETMENPKVDVTDNAMSDVLDTKIQLVPDQTDAEGDLMGHHEPVIDEPPSVVLEVTNCNSPSTNEKQVTFNLDPQTIILDSTLPVALASPIENGIIFGNNAENSSTNGSPSSDAAG